MILATKINKRKEITSTDKEGNILKIKAKIHCI